MEIENFYRFGSNLSSSTFHAEPLDPIDLKDLHNLTKGKYDTPYSHFHII
jgi:hypothetical protein